jgi:anti-anti-sigma regulatory factor
MLKISVQSSSRATSTVLKLEGQVTGRWVGELRRACEEHRSTPHPLTLDLKDVTFIDRSGIALFDEISSRVTLINCSLFAAEQLRPVLERHTPV